MTVGCVSVVGVVGNFREVLSVQFSRFRHIQPCRGLLTWVVNATFAAASVGTWAQPACVEDSRWKDYEQRKRMWYYERKVSSVSTLIVEPEAEPLRRKLLDWLTSIRSLSCEYTYESIDHLAESQDKGVFASNVTYRARGVLENRELYYCARPSYVNKKTGEYRVSTICVMPTRCVVKTEYYNSDNERVAVRVSPKAEDTTWPTRGKASPDLVFSGGVFLVGQKNDVVWLPEFFTTGYTYLLSHETGPVLVHTRAPNSNQCIRIYFNADGLPSSYEFGSDAGLTPPELKQLGRDVDSVFSLGREAHFANYAQFNGVWFPTSIARYDYKFIDQDETIVEEKVKAMCQRIFGGDIPSFEEFMLFEYDVRTALFARVLDLEQHARINPDTLKINEVLSDAQFEVSIPEGAEVLGAGSPNFAGLGTSRYQYQTIISVVLAAVALLGAIGLGGYWFYRHYLTRM